MEIKITRRQMLTLASGVVLLPIACGRKSNNTESFPAPNKHFIHGVASGDPDQNSVVIWTRISELEDAGQVSWQLATDAEFNNTIKVGNYQTDARRDYTVKVLVDDLPSGTEFFYKFKIKGETSPVGRTHTLPKGHVDKLVLALASCTNYPFGYFNAYDAIAK
ncbi:MAG: PhoD-like phosphatase N-terminal domain-containing protein, partial [Proteobacteria bacterium]|nr:PhoD-like phosphatase N-terminal domain-containing protein [Pseudomonadota bacterium]